MVLLQNVLSCIVNDESVSHKEQSSWRFRIVQRQSTDKSIPVGSLGYSSIHIRCMICTFKVQDVCFRTGRSLCLRSPFVMIGYKYCGSSIAFGCGFGMKFCYDQGSPNGFHQPSPREWLTVPLFMVFFFLVARHGSSALRMLNDFLYSTTDTFASVPEPGGNIERARTKCLGCVSSFCD